MLDNVEFLANAEKQRQYNALNDFRAEDLRDKIGDKVSYYDFCLRLDLYLPSL